MRKDECVRLQIPIIPLDHTDTNVPTQADGQSSLEIVGKAKFIAERGKLKLPWEGYVCKNLHSAILCGGSFMEKNKVVQELGNKRIVVENKYYILETSPLCPDPFPEPSISTASEDNDQNNIVSDETENIKEENRRSCPVATGIKRNSSCPVATLSTGIKRNSTQSP